MTQLGPSPGYNNNNNKNNNNNNIFIRTRGTLASLQQYIQIMNLHHASFPFSYHLACNDIIPGRFRTRTMGACVPLPGVLTIRPPDRDIYSINVHDTYMYLDSDGFFYGLVLKCFCCLLGNQFLTSTVFVSFSFFFFGGGGGLKLFYIVCLKCTWVR